MSKTVQQQIAEYKNKRKRNRIWKRIVMSLGCIVVFVTTYMLIIPAITQEADTFCGYTAHQHDESCYTRAEEQILTLQCSESTLGLHVHGSDCYDAEGHVLCGQADYVVHVHNELCAAEDGTLVCTLPEKLQHVHTEGCYTTVGGHTHAEECYEYQQGQLLCTAAEDPGHTHGEGCYSPGENLICTIEAGHIHANTCYSESTLVCADPEHAHEAGCYSEKTLICSVPENHSHEAACFEPVLTCQMEEYEGHTHEGACYEQIPNLICTLEEIPGEPVLVCTEPEAPVHAHGESCFQPVSEETLTCTQAEGEGHTHAAYCYGSWNLTCSTVEHEHSLSCFSDPYADVESPAAWKNTFADVELTGIWAEDVLAIAESQLGYRESTRNYIVLEDGETTKGYTRYGDWYGIPYGDWCAMYVAFCLNYAEVENFPTDANCPNWEAKLSELDLYRIPSEYVPKPGDIIFFDWEGDNSSDHVGLVETIDGTTVTTIEGNSGNRVARNTYDLFDATILGYGVLVQPSSPVIEEEIPDETYLDKEDTNAWVELVGDTTERVSEQAIQEEIAQNLAEETGKSRLRSGGGGAATFNLTRTTLRSTRAAGTPLDLTPYINSVAMYDSDGKPIPNGATVTEGDLIEFKIEYTITGQQLGVMNGETVTVNTDTLTYDIPDIFEIVQSDSGEIFNAGGNVVGSYLVDSTNGTITMSFANDYVEQNAKGMQIHGYISFFSTVKKITDEDDEHQDYEFTDKIILGVQIEEEIEAQGDLKIEKQKVSVDGEELIYEIKVTSQEGTKGSITITDQMSTGLTFKELVSVKKGNTTVNNPQLSVPANKGSFTMTLPEMKPGESYTIRYRCTADIDLLGADMTVQNTATVSGKDSQDNELKDRITVEHNFDVLRKTGAKNEDGSITWTITINHAKVDISGWTLQDIIRLQNQQVPYTGPVNIKDSSGRTVASNVKLPYTFPNGSTDTYTITYTTTHAFGDGQTIYNSAILSDDDTDVNVLTGVVIGTPFTKTGEAGEVIQDENGNYLLPITWTITIDTTNGPIAGDVYFVDEFRGYPSDDMYMTYDQLMDALANFEAEVLRVTGEELEGLSAWVYLPGPDTSNEIYGLTDLWNNVNGSQSKKFDRFAITLGNKGIPQGNVLTFSYETYGLFPNNIVSTTTFKNRFNLLDQYEVEGRVDYIEATLKATKYGIKYYDPEKHADQFWFWSEIDWSGDGSTTPLEYNQLKDSYLAWAIELSAPPTNAGQDSIVIYEDLPEGVSVKDVKLAFQNNVPTNKQLRLVQDGEEIEIGKTYKWEFTIYPADQYGQYRPQGAQNVSIDVKVTESGDLEISIPGIVLEVMSKYAKLYNLEENYGYLTIVTQINDDFDWPPVAEGSQVYINTFGNRFTVKTENDVVIDIGSQFQQVTKDEREGTIRKEATMDSNNIINYSVVLNAYNRDLIANSDTLAIHDELTYQSTDAQPLRLRLVPGSVKLYEIRMKSDGSYEKLGEVTANYQYEETTTEVNGVTNWTHTIDLNVPDNKALVLEYSYRASGNKNMHHDVFNTCTVSGVGHGNLEGDSKIEIEVKEATAQADTTGVLLYKVDANSDGIFLKDAKFNIYIWNKEQGKYIIVHHPNNGGTTFTTDANGMIVLDASTMAENQFAYNTAYYIVEIESPNGYYLGPEPYYFYIKHNDTEKYPSCIPSNFAGRALTSGDIIYRQNVSEFTEITVEKYWKDYGGKTVTVTGEEVTSVTLELWQMLQGDPRSAKKYETYTMTPDENGKWRLTITGLPKATKNADGTRGTDYLYYIKEVRVGGYTLESAENNSGINYGTIKLVNKETEGYILPETGGAGTQMFTLGGLLLMATATMLLLYKQTKRRREDTFSP